MSETLDTATARPDRNIERRLAFGVFAPPIAWFLHEVVALSVVGRQCHAGDSLAGWQWAVLLGVSIAAAVVALIAGATSFRIFRRWTGDAAVTRAEGWTRVEFVALLGIFISALLLLNIIYFGVMPFLVQPCKSAI